MKKCLGVGLIGFALLVSGCQTEKEFIDDRRLAVSDGSQNISRTSGDLEASDSTLTGMIPQTGSAGTVLHLFGEGLSGAFLVQLGTIPCSSLAILSDTHLSCTLGTGLSGTYPVRVHFSNGATPLVFQSPGFSYQGSGTLPSSLSVSGISPNQGSENGSERVSILGEGFDPDATAQFGSAFCTNLEVLSANRIDCDTPAHAAGSVTVTVRSGSETANLANAYTFLASQSGLAPEIFVVNPSQMVELALPSSIQIIGSNFESTVSVTLGGVPCAQPQVTSGNTIDCQAPILSTGAHDVIVTNLGSGEKETLAGGFTVNPSSLSFSKHPENLTAVEGGAAVALQCEVSGDDGSTNYQWRKNATPLSNGNGYSNVKTKTLVLDPQSRAMEGAYDCVATRGGIAATSESAQVKVLYLEIEEFLSSKTSANEGDAVDFSVNYMHHADADSVSIRWLKDGNVLNGATSNKLNLSNLTLSDAGDYQVEIQMHSGDQSLLAVSQIISLEVKKVMVEITNQELYLVFPNSANPVSEGSEVILQPNMDLGMNPAPASFTAGNNYEITLSVANFQDPIEFHPVDGSHYVSLTNMEGNAFSIDPTLVSKDLGNVGYPFPIQFTPPVSATQTTYRASLTFGFDPEGDGDFRFEIVATVEPKIDSKHGILVNIPQAKLSGLESGQTISMSQSGLSSSFNIEIHNVSGRTLSLQNIDGPRTITAYGDLTMGSFPISVIPAGGKATITVTWESGSSGTRTGLLVIGAMTPNAIAYSLNFEF